jgi:hypothetical protein
MLTRTIWVSCLSHFLLFAPATKTGLYHLTNLDPDFAALRRAKRATTCNKLNAPG